MLLAAERRSGPVNGAGRKEALSDGCEEPIRLGCLFFSFKFFCACCNSEFLLQGPRFWMAWVCRVSHSRVHQKERERREVSHLMHCGVEAKIDPKSPLSRSLTLHRKCIFRRP